MATRKQYILRIYLHNDVWTLPTYLAKQPAQDDADKFYLRGFDYCIDERIYTISEVNTTLEFTVNGRDSDRHKIWRRDGIKGAINKEVVRITTVELEGSEEE